MYTVPPPSKCPDCRWQQHLSFRNEYAYFKRNCDFSGKAIVSMHPEGTPFPVYAIEDWLSDSWDAKEYGREYDFNRPFFEQFKELANTVPHYSRFTDPSTDENSDYTNAAAFNKNCYLICQAAFNQDCYYSRGINDCTDCTDCFRIANSQQCYEGISLVNCNRCFFVKNSSNCSNCYFSTELSGCTNCFGCHGLTKKEYCIFNKQVSKEEWEEKVEKLTLTHSVIDQMKKQSDTLRLTVPHRASHILQSEDVVGEDLVGCKGCQMVFDSKDQQDCAYNHEVTQDAKDCQDLSMFGLHTELLYNCVACGIDAQCLLFSSHSWTNVYNLIYCESCYPSVNNCFGCFGIKKSEYCILNKQYTKEQYEELVPRIIEHMQQTGQWGQFFSPDVSAFGYNSTIAQDYFPLTREQAIEKGFNWHDEQTKEPPRETATIPDSIEDVPADITEQVCVCEQRNTPYKITPQELSFYKRYKLPLPRRCPEERHQDRIRQRNPRTLWKRECGKCKKEVQTTYSPDRPEIIYCEDCYLSTVY